MNEFHQYFKENLGKLKLNDIGISFRLGNINNNYFQLHPVFDNNPEGRRPWSGYNCHYEVFKKDDIYTPELHLERNEKEQRKNDQIKGFLKQIANKQANIESFLLTEDSTPAKARLYVDTGIYPINPVDMFHIMKSLIHETYEDITAIINGTPPNNNRLTNNPAIASREEQNNTPQNKITTRTPENLILYGPPGTGKTYHVVPHAISIIDNGINNNRKEQVRIFIDEQKKEDGRICMVTFHQSYGYEEFVEGLRPVLVKENHETDGSGHTNKDFSNVQYHIQDGPFLKMCQRAEKYPDNNYVIVIDEINRGNISKIFGELITLIEDDKRMFINRADHPANGNNGLSITLPYSGKAFSVPPNLSIIGTMNTADRSLALLDTALRRRFDFKEMMPDPDLLKDINVKGIDLKQLLTVINRRIVALYDREHTIGHAYFLGLSNLETEDDRFAALGNIFKNRIIPLLQEYFFDDWAKIRLVLGDNKKSKECQFIASEEVTMDALFGNTETDDLEWMESKRVFHVNLLAFHRPEAYLGIYAKAATS
jgi:hypothetical protein